MTFAPLSLTGLKASRDTAFQGRDLFWEHFRHFGIMFGADQRHRILLLPALKPARLLLILTAMALLPASARADFHICNNTGSRIGVAIGYKDAEGWTTEGWWNLSARSCETLLRGTLVARYYYVYAIDYDRGGEWSGQAYMCTRDKEFTIRGTQDCLARGFDRTGFFEVDTSEQKSWTVQLTETADDPQRRPLAPNTPLLPTPGRREPSQAPTAPR
jgi:uncharacterized membrane protein